jgi:uncharacterized protein (DUF1778 family)
MSDAVERAAEVIAAEIVAIVDETSPDELLAHLAEPGQRAGRLVRAKQDVETLATALVVLRRRGCSSI